jgi:heptaprenyl diphosphate synthase
VTATELTDFAGLVADRLVVLTDMVPRSLRSSVASLAGRPGKYMRAVLLAACARFGRADPVRLVRLAAVVELLHLASLLHDDVVDRADLRRGRPAARVVVGDERAVLAGVACFAVAGTEASDIGDDVGRVVAQAVARLAYGELLDVERAFDTSLAIADYLELAERKTGELFRLSCVLGAAAAAAPGTVISALGQFGLNFGVAFQILDDCLDLGAGGDGKPTGTDHMMGLFGAPTLYALGADPAGELAALLLSPGFSQADLPAVRALLTSRDGFAAAHRLARTRYELALDAVRALADQHGSAAAGLMAVADVFWQLRQ